MIDFRYHLVSIIAVFLALAVGLLVGVTALSGPAENLLHSELTRVSRVNSSLVKDKRQLSSQVSADQAFAQAGSQKLLSGLLTGQNVVLVLAPNADGTVTGGVTKSLQQAGATVTGQVQLNPSFLDTSAKTENSLRALANAVAPTAGVVLPSPSSSQAGQQSAAAVIAAAVLSTDGVGLTSSASQAVLSQFAQGGYLSAPGLRGSAPATLAVLVVPGGAAPTASDNQVLVAVASELRAAGRGTVMVGGVSSIGPGSVISAENGAGAGQVSTIDNADTESGQIMTVWALVKAAAGAQPLAYGISSGRAPSPAPTPSPSDTPTVSSSPGTKAHTAASRSKAGHPR